MDLAVILEHVGQILGCNFAEFFQSYMPSSITFFMHIFSVEKYILGVDFCLGQHAF
jgi:hypothetical protein